MKKPVWIGLGVLLILIGGVWGLQGLGVFGGSAMSGKTLWAVVGNAVFGANAQWLDIFHVYDRLSGDQPLTDLPQTLTAIAVWVVLPTTIGVVRSLRREVK